jgi:pilus assembly protein CpaF
MMSIRDRLTEGVRTGRVAPTVLTSPGTETASEAYRALRAQIHRELIDRVDTRQFSVSQAGERLRDDLRRQIEQLLAEHGAQLNAAERRQIVTDIHHEVTGLGPLEPLLADPTVSDILVNSPRQVYVERAGLLERTAIVFDDDQHLLSLIDRIVSRVGRRIDESSPMVDARLGDGSRVNAIIPPLAIDGPCLSIRRFGAVPLQIEDLVARGAMPQPVADLLAGMVRARLNILVSGGTGAGKTTLLNVLSSFIPHDERVITIEDAAELQLQQPHVVRLETRPSNIEGRGEVSQRALVRNSLRMRPDRIILGEVRGGEAFDMLQAMNTGHEGSLATIHANAPRDALMRLENMVGMAELSLSPRSIRQQIASAVDAVIQLNRLSDGTRRVTALTEVTGMEAETISMQDLFVFRQTAVTAQGQVVGAFHATGVRPRFADRLAARSIALPEGCFDPRCAWPSREVSR